MDKYEVLVHIAAPTSAKDNAKYHAQAAAILDFYSVAKNKVLSSPEDTLAQGHNVFAKRDYGLDTRQNPGNALNLHERSSSPTTFVGRQDINNGGSRHAEYFDLERNNLVVSSVTSGVLCNSAVTFTAPLLKADINSEASRHDSQCLLQVFRTPELLRPRTAPTISGSFPILSGFDKLVPDTALPRNPRAFKRSFSEIDSSSIERSPSDDLDSWTAGKAYAHTNLISDHLSTRSSLTGNPLNIIDPAKRRKPNVNNTTRENSLGPWEESDGEGEQSLEITFYGPHLDTLQQNCTASSTCFLIPYHDYSWTTSPSSNEHDSSNLSEINGDTSTASPSQSQRIPEGMQARLAPSPTPPPVTAVQSSPIDLTSPTTPRVTPFKRHPSNNTTHVPAPDLSISVPDTIGPKAQESVSAFLHSLPTEIFPPSPPTSDTTFTTRLARGHDRIAQKTPIAEYFRPAFIERDSYRFERGYWALSLMIVQDSAPVEDDTMDVWCRSDFEKLYSSLQKNITSGISGWSVRVFLEMPTTHSPPPVAFSDDDDAVCINLKVTCYAEVIPHTFLLLWVLSGKRTGSVGMCWYGADNKVVVRMGKDRSQGNLGIQGGKRHEKRVVGGKTWGCKGGGVFGAV